ncbi:hypothetical protein ACN27F_17595 [Solwaraspora sp. WMMB335]|uniref:hypothetical protein n=1 Tax=Solwaraspora sp. WMMB335 TaxID=3404118 RepID=UPI003B93BFBF
MRGAQLADLLSATPAGTTDALDVLDGFDRALVGGLGRLDQERASALADLAGAVAGTPLGAAVGEAVDKIVAGSVGEEQLLLLAGARTAIAGAVHDALVDQLDTALGRTRSEWPALPPAADGPAVGGPTGDGPAVDGRLLAARSWLAELAITGWRNVDHDLVSASQQALQALLTEPTLRRAAVLLDGLATELHACSPVAMLDRLPRRRWADLWARGMLLTRRDDVTPDTERISGRLLLLGADVHEHATAVQVQVHGLLEAAGEAVPRLVRASVSAAKVDTIVGPVVWQLLSGHQTLLAALAGRLSLELTEMPLRPSGDLLWRDAQARVGEPADPFATARVQLAGVLAPAAPPLDRHPVTIAEPVLVEGYPTAAGDGVGGLVFDVDGSPLPVATDRLPGCGPLTVELAARSSACVGLLRWDAGRWSLQPLGVQATVKRKTVDVHTGDWAQGPTDPKVAKALTRSGDPIGVLRERAGRLLRK